jgi:glutamate-1-semialdehyde 2,1-aminomutase
VSRQGTAGGFDIGAFPVSQTIYHRALECMPGGNTRSPIFISPQPPYLCRGIGYEVEDADGHRLIDLQNCLTALIHGHAHPAIVKAATSAIGRGSCFGLPTASDVELAEHLHRRQTSLENLRFTNSGSEAVMMAIRGARAYTGRDRFLRFAGCYHGCYDAVAKDGAPGRPVALEAEVISVPYDNTEHFLEAIGAHGDELACVVMDLMPNRNGLTPAAADFVQLVRRETEQRGILLVIDEVITFRLSQGGFQERYGVRPDLTCLGKIVGGGFPVGAFGGRADVMRVFDPRETGAVDHGGTFAANPVTMSAGLACMEMLNEEEIRRINGLGDRLRLELQALGYEVNGYGSLLRVVGDIDTQMLWWRLYRSGLLIARNGLMCISTAMNQEVIDVILERFV